MPPSLSPIGRQRGNSIIPKVQFNLLQLHFSSSCTFFFSLHRFCSEEHFVILSSFHLLVLIFFLLWSLFIIMVILLLLFENLSEQKVLLVTAYLTYQKHIYWWSYAFFVNFVCIYLDNETIEYIFFYVKLWSSVLILRLGRLVSFLFHSLIYCTTMTFVGNYT